MQRRKYKLSGCWLRPGPDRHNDFFRQGDVVELTEAEAKSLGNKVTPLEPESIVKPEPPKIPKPDIRRRNTPKPEAMEVPAPEPEEEPEEIEVQLIEDDEEEVPEEEEPEEIENQDTTGHATHVGGGWYELPDGSRVQGKSNIPEEWR